MGIGAGAYGEGAGAGGVGGDGEGGGGEGEGDVWVIFDRGLKIPCKNACKSVKFHRNEPIILLQRRLIYANWMGAY